MAESSAEAEGAHVKAAFGAKNRARLIDEYFTDRSGSPVVPSTAWEHVYKLLLWPDATTGLAHCYESDKCQPGKNWYTRALAFHGWISDALGASPSTVAADIDWLFRRATTDLATEALRNAARLTASAEKQRRPYETKNFPKPGEDPELVAIVKEVLGDHLRSQPSDEEWQRLVQRVRQYLTLENKRKNLVGEGFEDVIADVVRRTCGGSSVSVHTRRLLQDLPGFNRARHGDKPNKVDVSILRPDMRTLVTAKWSVRADREKQFTTDFSDYVSAESDRKPFEYVFVTNEFDPARLMRACENLAGNALMFTHVVHISTDALRATYGASPEASMGRVLRYVDEGRLISLERWLGFLNAPA